MLIDLSFEIYYHIEFLMIELLKSTSYLNGNKAGNLKLILHNITNISNINWKK